jgi:ribosomal protein S18 acetylase RimI-like enzyme
MPAQVRRATLVDCEKIASFQLLMASETENKQLDETVVLPAVIAVFDDPQKGFYVVGENEGLVVSSLLITYEWSDWRNTNLWYIQSVFVEESYRGQGIFKQMYRFVVEAAKVANVKHVRLYVETGNHRAQSVYESLGMKKLPYLMYDVEIQNRLE